MSFEQHLEIILRLPGKSTSLAQKIGKINRMEEHHHPQNQHFQTRMVSSPLA